VLGITVNGATLRLTIPITFSRPSREVYPLQIKTSLFSLPVSDKFQLPSIESASRALLRRANRAYGLSIAVNGSGQWAASIAYMCGECKILNFGEISLCMTLSFYSCTSAARLIRLLLLSTRHRLSKGAATSARSCVDRELQVTKAREVPIGTSRPLRVNLLFNLVHVS
jgi:hypothetical protein